MLRAVAERRKAGDFEGALKKADELVNCEHTAQAFHLRSLVLYALKRHNLGLADAENASELDPKNPEYYFHAGNLKNAMNDFHGAAQSWEKALGLAPAHAQAHCMLGLYCVNFNKPETGFAHLREAIRINPGFALAHYSLAIGLIKIHSDFRVASGHLDRAVELTPNNADFRFERAHIRFIMGDNQGALSDLEQLGLIEPNFPGASQLAGKVKVMMGNYVNEEGNC